MSDDLFGDDFASRGLGPTGLPISALPQHKKTAPYVKGSDTSKAAAESVEPDLGRLEGLVLSHISSRGLLGATDDETEVALDLSHQTASARRRRLVQLGRVVDSGMRRKTRSGRKAVVWRVAEFPPLRHEDKPKRPTQAQTARAIAEIRRLYVNARTRPSDDVNRLMRWANVQLAKTTANGK